MSNYVETSYRGVYVPRKSLLNSKMPYPYEIDEFERKEAFSKMERSRN
jgi:hypothetical protein